jgi:curli production assembly/transport component CsgF
VEKMRDPKHALDVFKRGASPLLLLLGFASAHATELVYVPVNPNFGGSPLNGGTLLSQAQAQNRTKDPDLSSANGKQSALEQFNDSLQRAVLGRLAAAATSNVVGSDGKLKAGTVETTDLLITVSDLGGGSYRIVTLDKNTGRVTSIDL